MSRRNNFFHSTAFNITATVLLICALAAFYKFAISDYSKNINKNFETMETDKVNNVEATPKTIEQAFDALKNVESSRTIDRNLLKYCNNNIRKDIYDRICDYMETNGTYDDSMWQELCGYTLNSLYDFANHFVTEDNFNTFIEDSNSFTIAFAGDVSLDTTPAHWWSPLVVHKNNRANLIESAFSSTLSQKMQEADVFCVNLESPFINESSIPVDNWFRHGAILENINVLGEMGVDFVNIANNRIYDYADDGFIRTLKALQLKNIKYVGGGESYSGDTSTPRYIYACGRKIAIVSAAQTLFGNMAPESDKNTPGILYATNSTKFLTLISEAKENSDYVIVYIDWSEGANETPDETQKALAHSFVNAGADIVIGTRGTVMQSIEYYSGVPIIYGIGNFWYETDIHQTIFVEIKFDREVITESSQIDTNVINEKKTTYYMSGTPDIYCLPCVQDYAVTRLALGSDEGYAITSKLVALSNGKIAISKDGLLTENIVKPTE
ncbi:MAG: CapA family protein [Clostridia bacterium]|nr:CapA family protein [Clostridia bacterium]